MTKLYFVRHGKTEWNLSRKLQGGQADSPLLEDSLIEAQLLGEQLKDIAFGQVFVSTQLRAVKTCEMLLSEFVEAPGVTYVDGLKEFGLGTLEGQTIEDAIDAFPEQMHHLRNNAHEYNPIEFQGETYQALIDRSLAVVHEAMENYPEQDLLFISHGVTLVAVIQTLLGKPLSDIREAGGLDNTSLSVLEVTPLEMKLILWNDKSHLTS